MEVTREVILDLLPLYMADEVSPETREFVHKYLEAHPELAQAARQSSMLESAQEIPIPLSKEDKMEAYLKAKHLMFWRTVIVAALIAFVALVALGLLVLAFFHSVV
jgi:hypothetical protein